MSRSLLLLLVLSMPLNAASAQEAAPPEAPPPPEAAPVGEPPEPPKPPEPPPSPPPPAAPAPSAREEKPRMETLISGNIATGAFGGPVLMYSRVLDRDALFVGGKGGLIANRSFVLGAAGFGMVSRVLAPEGAPEGGENLKLDFGYGGLWLEYILLPDKLVHASIGALIGGGGLSYRRIRRGPLESRIVEDDIVFVAEPSASLELNILPSLKAALGVGYRYVGSVDVSGLRREDLRGLTGSLTLKFGRFTGL